ncbi:MAG: LemA family protein [Rhodobacteraceae bacterium]|nr:LemA family protein [Paracoccaceae bacterium]
MILAAAIVGAAVVVVVLRIAREAARVAALRAAAIDLLWKRYNLTGDLITWATHDGGPEAADRLSDIAAAREEIMKMRADENARLKAEDKLQTALNDFYRAAERDEDLITGHEIVMIIAHLALADAAIADKAAAYNDTLAAFARRRAGGVNALVARAMNVSAPAPITLTVTPEQCARTAQFLAAPGADSRT